MVGPKWTTEELIGGLRMLSGGIKESGAGVVQPDPEFLDAAADALEATKEPPEMTWCPVCDGYGKIYRNTTVEGQCHGCTGTGKVTI